MSRAHLWLHPLSPRWSVVWLDSYWCQVSQVCVKSFFMVGVHCFHCDSDSKVSQYWHKCFVPSLQVDISTQCIIKLVSQFLLTHLLMIVMMLLILIIDCSFWAVNVIRSHYYFVNCSDQFPVAVENILKAGWKLVLTTLFKNLGLLRMLYTCITAFLKSEGTTRDIKMVKSSHLQFATQTLYLGF